MLGLAILVLIVVGPLLGFYVDLLWFQRLGYDAVYLARVGYQAQLTTIALLVALAALLLNALTGLRLTRRSRDVVGRGTLAWVLVLGSAAAAVILALIAGGAWDVWTLATHARSFGQTDPVFGLDASFYVLTLPALDWLWGWLLALWVVAALAAVGVHVSEAALAAPQAPVRLNRGAVAHLSVLGAGLMALLAFHHRLAMLSLPVESHGAVSGAGWTDVHVRIPVEWTLVGLCALLALLLLVNVGLRSGALLYAAPALWAVAAFLLAMVLPATVQGLTVKPAELSRERDYLAREIAATNHAFGLDAMTVRDFPDSAQITPRLLDANPETVGNLRLWDYRPLLDAYANLQTFKPYYDFNDVDIDRYQLPGGYRQVMISARELNTAPLTAAQTWVNLHLKYTHGYGAAASPVTQVAEEGKPAFLLSDIPPSGELPLTRPQIYFGETQSDYVVVDSLEPELDYQNGDQETYHSWQGTHGVPIGSALRKALFGLRFGDANLFLSSQIGPSSQILYHRSLTERLRTIAPFLSYDADPYLVVSGGRMYWIADAYTSSDVYPYGSPVQNPDGSQVAYMRNSVKAVVDAYEGTVSFYVADPSDPIVQDYSAIFPTLFQPISAMPADLRAHVRYPVDYFELQMQQWSTFHMKDPQDFYNKGDSWQVAQEVLSPGAAPVPLQPYYVLMRLPGEARAEFVLIQPFTPLGKKNMVAWVAARSDGDSYGKLLNFRFPNGSQIDGPAQVENRIDQTPAVSRDFTLFNTNGSTVIRGDLLVIPIGDAIIFVKPIYISSTSGTGLPELKKVIVATQDTVAYEDTLAQALADVAGGRITVAPSAPPGTPPSPAGTPINLASLVAQANQLYAAMQADLRAGDLRKYADDQDHLGQVLQQLQQRESGGGTAASPSPP